VDAYGSSPLSINILGVTKEEELAVEDNTKASAKGKSVYICPDDEIETDVTWL
jgi:hypothetical protein